MQVIGPDRTMEAFRNPIIATFKSIMQYLHVKEKKNKKGKVTQAPKLNIHAQRIAHSWRVIGWYRVEIIRCCGNADIYATIIEGQRLLFPLLACIVGTLKRRLFSLSLSLVYFPLGLCAKSLATR